MAITFPLSSILTAVGFVAESYEFKLNYRQEQSRTAGGKTIVKDFGRPLWSMKATTQALPFDEALAYEALLEAMDGGAQTFLAHDLRRPFPVLHKDGEFGDYGTVSQVGADNKSLSIGNLADGITISMGDYLRIGSMLYRALSSSTSQGGATGMIEVRPHLFPGVASSQLVRLKRAGVSMKMLPNSIIVTPYGALHSSVSFSAFEA